jgi:glycosyltransferase involved in cell wall biosynthesis
MNIAILVPTFSQYSGIDKVVQQQSMQCIRNGDKVTIFTFKAEMGIPLNAKLCVLGMPKSLLGQRIYRLFFPLDLIKTLKWVPRLKQYDVIYSHQYPMTWLAYLAKKYYGIKFIYYNHGIAPPWTFSNLPERIYMRLFTYLANWTIKRADSAISISHYLQKELNKETKVNSKVIYNTIDNQRFHKGLDGLIIRNKLELGASPIILYVGRISPHKGIHLLIESFNLIIGKIPNVKLIIVGKHLFASYSEKLKQISNDSVLFVSDVPDDELPYYYAACDVYATATLWEGFDLPVVEAQSCGKPVVAFDIGPHPEIIDNDGFLVANNNTTELANAIIEILMGRRNINA